MGIGGEDPARNKKSGTLSAQRRRMHGPMSVKLHYVSCAELDQRFEALDLADDNVVGIQSANQQEEVAVGSRYRPHVESPETYLMQIRGVC
jgi:hypothetical protein